MSSHMINGLRVVLPETISMTGRHAILKRIEEFIFGDEIWADDLKRARHVVVRGPGKGIEMDDFHVRMVARDETTGRVLFGETRP